ncbi:MAG: DNA polymerase III subunit gamma/tau [Colwellia sp.]
MSYQVLARKWRPKNFEALMGQEHVVTVLVNALSQQRLHHAYLFTGTRGVGKTTIARIFAKSLNCETGITAKPCGTCDTCLEIDQGRFVDLLEIDAASKTKVDDTREILDNVQYAPTRGRYKVYLIDEVHMLSRHSFNALLKTLEEPPEHVKFILATTDPQKLPVTVLSRCLQFHLKALTVNQIETKLAEILAEEEVTHDAGTLTLLAKSARGSMRDSLSLTDQAIAQGQGSITLANIQQMLGGIDQNWVYKILIALLKQDGGALMSLSQEIASYAPSYSRLFAELIQLFHQIAIIQIAKQHFDLPTEQAQLLEKFSQAMSPEDIQLYYQISVNGRKDLPYAADEQAAFDMTLIRLLAFKPMQASHVVSSVEHKNNNVALDLALDFDEIELNKTDIAKPEQLTKPNTTEPAKRDEKPLEIVTNKAEIEEANAEVINVEESKPDTIAVLNEAPQTINEEQQQNQLAQEMFTIEQQAADIALQTPNVQTSEIQASVVANHIQEKNEPESYAIKSNLNEEHAIEKQQNIIADSPVSAVLATRNMLRSRKKQLDQQAKKPSDAIKRQSQNALTHENVADNSIEANKSVIANKESDQPTEKKEITPAPQTPYQADNIDPATIRKANQVDQWAHMIDSMELTARLRQLAIHATIDEKSTDDNLILRLDQATKHLKTDVAHQQLQTYISQFLSRNITVTIDVVDKTVADPYQIQSQINDKRFDYAKELLQKDEIVVAMQSKFQATLDEDSVSAL